MEFGIKLALIMCLIMSIGLVALGIGLCFIPTLPVIAKIELSILSICTGVALSGICIGSIFEYF